MAKKIDITEEDYLMLKPTGDRILVKRDAGKSEPNPVSTMQSSRIVKRVSCLR